MKDIFLGFKRDFISGCLVVVLLLSGVINSFASEEPAHNDQLHDTPEEEEGFKPNEFIFDHIGDSYEWHLVTINGKHISIPLLVILVSKEKGLVVFTSNKLHHGHSGYKGFKFESQGEYKGKMVEIMEDGSVRVPLDLSISKNVAALLLSIVLLAWLFIAVAKTYKRNPNKAPKGIQTAIELIIIFIRDDVAKPSIGNKNYERFMPYLLTVFFFIWINNMLGLFPLPPGGANLTGNITVTMALAIFTFILTTVNGNKNYWRHIFNPPGVPWWLKFPLPLMPIIEILGMLTKPFVLMVRLFANISAGHIIAMGFFSLIFIFGEMSSMLGYGASIISVVFVVFMSMLELLVAFIQAFVFTLLSAIYFGMATEEHH